jgi:type II secretion system protein N
MRDRIRALLPKVGFPVFYLLCLAFFARWTFPYEKLKDRIVLAFNQQQRDTNGQQELRIDEVGPSWLSGLDAKGVHLIGPPPEPGKPPSELKIDEVRGSVSLMGFLFGHTDVSVRADGFGGTVKGELDDSTKERKIELSLDGLNLGAMPFVVQAAGIPAEGTVGGAIKLTMPEAKTSKATGTVSIEASDVAVGDGKAKLQGMLALPRLVIGSLTLTGDAKDGVLKVSKISAGGRDVELQGEGRIQLRESLADSFCDLNVRFKINDAYRTKNDTTRGLFGAPGSTIPALFEMAPKVKQSKRSDGFYGWHMHGPLSRPDFEPAPYAGGATAPAAPNPAPTQRPVSP